MQNEPYITHKEPYTTFKKRPTDAFAALSFVLPALSQHPSLQDNSGGRGAGRRSGVHLSGSAQGRFAARCSAEKGGNDNLGSP